ncbi:MAG: hypothetical protein JW384_02013 [Nitrosomonadaceae bacterium]|nr:hypothetical protein [Nitrosomonadaceae bacterium]
MVSITGKNIRNPYTRQKETRDPREWLQLFDRMRASRSRMEWDDGLIEPGITNHVLNPQFRVDSNADGIADNWNAVGAPTTSLSIPLKVIGLRSQKAICDSINTQGIETDTITLTVGTRYVASAYVYVTSGDKVFLEARNQNAGTTIAQSPVVLLEEQGGWVRLEIAFVAPHASFRLRVVRNSANATAETSFYVSAAQVEALSDKRFRYYQSYASTYCDGEQPRGRWSGAPHASTSVRDSTYKVFITNINEAETKRPGILEIVQGIGAEHRIVMSLAEIE